MRLTSLAGYSPWVRKESNTTENYACIERKKKILWNVWVLSLFSLSLPNIGKSHHAC